MTSDLICHESYCEVTNSTTSRIATCSLKDPVVEEDIVKDPVKAFKDLRLLKDDRILKNLLRLEEESIPAIIDYLRNGQPDLSPSMRKIVADWMLQVCQVRKEYIQ